MQVKDYINKNLPNLNWNILPQIFEDEGIELTEEIKAYLKETPGNTNWNILNEISRNKSNILFESDCKFTTPAPVDWVLFQDYLIPKTQIFDILNIGDQVKVTIGENVSTGIITEEETSSGYSVVKHFNLDAPFDDCCITWDKYGQSIHTQIYLAIVDEPGTYHVKIEKI